MSEVYMHIAIADFYLLSVTGPKMPEGITRDTEKTVTAKADVIDWLKRSLDAVKTARASLKPAGEADVGRWYSGPIAHADSHAAVAATAEITSRFLFFMWLPLAPAAHRCRG